MTVHRAVTFDAHGHVATRTVMSNARHRHAATLTGTDSVVNVWETGHMPPGAPRRPAPPAPGAAAGDGRRCRPRGHPGAQRGGRPSRRRRRRRPPGRVRRRRHRGHLPERGARPLVPGAGPARPVGRVVRAVQAALADPGAPGRRRATGSWILAKIDVDANPRISQALQVQSIPTVFAVIGGQLVPGFQGLLPEAQLREFVARRRAGRSRGRAARASRRRPTARAPTPSTARLRRQRIRGSWPLRRRLQSGDYRPRGAAIPGDPRRSSPPTPRPPLALGQVRLLQRLESYDARAVPAAPTPHPDDLAAQLAAADLAFAGNDATTALATTARLAAAAPSGEDRDSVRQRMIDYFDLLGPDDPRVAPARREMARVLF